MQLPDARLERDRTRILSLCRRLALAAADLDEARRAEPAWYAALEPLYRVLDPLIAEPSPALEQALLSDPCFLALEPDLQRLRAALEQDQEFALARRLLAAPDCRERLERLVLAEGYWSLSPELRRALGNSRRVLFAGSGPLPLTALAIAQGLPAEVTCLDCHPEALALGQALIDRLGGGARVRSLRSDIRSFEGLGDYDAIVGAALLGVGLDKGQANVRDAIARDLAWRLRPDATLVLRDPRGLGRLLYPALDPAALRGFAVERLAQRPGPGPSYRIDLLIVRRTCCRGTPC